MEVIPGRIGEVLNTHNGVHAKRLIYYGHSVVELWYVLVGLDRVQNGEQMLNERSTNWNLSIRYCIPNALIKFLLDIRIEGQQTERKGQSVRSLHRASVGAQRPSL